MKHKLPKKTILFLSLILLTCVAAAGGSIAYASTNNDYPVSVHENNTYNGNYSRTIITETEGTYPGIATATAIVLSGQKTAGTTIVSSSSFYLIYSSVRSYAKLINKNGNVSSTPSTCTEFTFNSAAGYWHVRQ